MLAMSAIIQQTAVEPTRAEMVGTVQKGETGLPARMDKMLGRQDKVVVMAVMVDGVEMVNPVVMERMPPASAEMEAMVEMVHLVETDRMVAMVETDLQEATQEMAPMVREDQMDQIYSSPSNQSTPPSILMKHSYTQKSSHD